MGCTLVFDPVSYLLFITVFEFAITFWVWLVNSFQKVSLFPDYNLDDTLDNDTPNGDNVLMIMMMKIILMIITGIIWHI